MNIAFIGIGNVGFALADNLAKGGHTVRIAARDPLSERVKSAISKNSALAALPMEQAIADAQVIFLATPFDANETVLKNTKALLAGKILVDCTNPVAADLSHGLKSIQSGGELVQKLAPEAKVVKAFTVYGFENFQDSAYPNYTPLKPAMLIAGNDAQAKATVAGLCDDLNWEPVDTGDISMSLHLEHMTLLWIKMARVQGKGADFVWGLMTR